MYASDEKWRPIRGFEGYEASNFGRIRSHRRILKPWGEERPVVALSIRGRVTKRFVGVLICETWCGKKPSPKHQAAHWDGNPWNNHFSNLRWTTQAENEKDKIRHGRYNHAPKGSRHLSAKLNEIDIPRIRFLRKEGLSYQEIANQYHVNWSAIRDIITRRTWKHV